MFGNLSENPKMMMVAITAETSLMVLISMLIPIFE
jgi:hypothetical protein